MGVFVKDNFQGQFLDEWKKVFESQSFEKVGNSIYSIIIISQMFSINFGDKQTNKYQGSYFMAIFFHMLTSSIRPFYSSVLSAMAIE